MIVTSLTVSEMLELVRDTLAADAALLAWCNAQFSKNPSVWLGIDEDNPPESSQYPLIGILGINQMRGDDKREITWEISLGVAILQEGKATSGITITYTGALQVETLRELCEDALFRARIAGEESGGESVSISDYPLFSSFTTITFKGLKTTRRGLPGR